MSKLREQLKEANEGRTTDHRWRAEENIKEMLFNAREEIADLMDAVRFDKDAYAAYKALDKKLGGAG